MSEMYRMQQYVGEYSKSLFANGYIVSKEKVAYPDQWQHGVFGDYYFYHDENLKITKADYSGAAIICFGFIFDTRCPDLSQASYIEILAEKLSVSIQCMLDELFYSGGRYVLMYKTKNGNTYVLNDATGMRCIFFMINSSSTISSHHNLLKVNIEAGIEEDDRGFKFGFPGRQTPLKDVWLLTPNTTLCLENGSVHRYWPLYPVPNLSLSDAAEKVALCLMNSFKWIDRRYRHFTTLTAGLDSRVTASITSHDTRYVTYYRSDEVDTDMIDLRTTKKITQDHGWTHIILGPNSREDVPESFIRAVQLNSYYRHIPRMPWAFLQHVIEDNAETIHIRSNLSEIGRMFYQNRNITPQNGADLNALYSPRKQMQTSNNSDSFQEFAITTGFFDAPVEHTSLFYWEHRMGSWHSQICNETDISCETVSLYNSRYLLSMMLSVDESFQRKSLLLKRVIYLMRSSLANYDNNGRPFEPTDENDYYQVFGTKI